MLSSIKFMCRFLAVPFALALGCNDPQTPGGEDAQVSLGSTTFTRDPPRKVDLLFVIDDSASMAEEQIILANNLASFVDVLERPDVRFLWRAAVIRSSGSACGGQAGEALTTSCRERLDDFVVPPGQEASERDLRSICESSCLHDSIPTLPTTVELDLVPKSRPWLERLGWDHNVEVDAGEALTCLGLTGVSGCDYESPFEAIENFIRGTYLVSSPHYGFLRLDATLLVVIISDEDDCTLVDPSILDPQGERVFWPESATGERAPSSVCFRAGSDCVDEGESWDCGAVDRRADGSQTGDPDEAVLLSLSVVEETLARLKEEKREAGHSAGVHVATIGGFGDGNANGSGWPSWPKQGPEGFVEEFGAGPGCEVEDLGFRALAPPRLHALTQLFTDHSTFSSCSPDYGPALEVIAASTGPQAPPFCFTHCASIEEEAHAPPCRVYADTSEGQVDLPECVADENGYLLNSETNDYKVPEGSEACVAYLIDPGDQLTESFLDDMSPECATNGYNLEFKVAKKPGSTLFLVDRYVASCVLDVSEDACPAG